MSRHDDVGRRRSTVGSDPDGVCPIRSADTGGHAGSRLDGNGKCGPQGRSRTIGQLHHGKLEPLDLLLCQRQADESAPVGRHESDGLGSHPLRGHAQVTFIFPVLVVDQNDQFASGDIFQRGLDPLEHARIDVEGTRRSGWQ